MRNMQPKKIITVGFSPAWDVVCKGDGLDWGGHKVLAEKTSVPAGKALNVNKALARMGTPSIAAGFWGANDYRQMREYIKKGFKKIQFSMSVTKGTTRENITIIDTAQAREMHLRDASALANKKKIIPLKKKLEF